MTFSKKNIFIILTPVALAGLWWKEFQRESPVAASVPLEIKAVSSASPSVSQAKEAADETSLSPVTAQKIQVLDEILISHNDNDPRMDSTLKDLDSETKSVLRKKYNSLPETQRNARGTIVFLIGRNLTDPADYQFLEQVLGEAPCLGMVQCTQPMNATGLDGHEENGFGVVLDYPQLTALKAVENHPAKSESLKRLQDEVLQIAKASRSAKVSEAAEAVLKKIR